MKVNKNFCILSKKLWLKILNFFQKISKFWEFFGIWFFSFLVHFLYFVTYGRKYWADIMFWISWFCSLLLVKWPIFGQLFGLISQKATTGWFSFWLFSTYLCMYFMKLKWFFMDHDLFETEASQPLCYFWKSDVGWKSNFTRLQFHKFCSDFLLPYMSKILEDQDL